METGQLPSTVENRLILGACCTLSTVLGSIHAFSVFIPEWEVLNGATRAGASLIYSVALAALTVFVLIGHLVFIAFAPSTIFLLVGFFGASGLWLSAYTESLMLLMVAYGVVFGGANGLGYGYSLQLAGQSLPSRRGLAMGLVTAFYAVGATVAPFLFVMLIDNGGNTVALKVTGAVLLVVSVSGALVLKRVGASFEAEPSVDARLISPVLKRTRMILWWSYGTSVVAGLMLIGHAYGVAVWTGLDVKFATRAVIVMAIGNMIGGFSAGYLANRFSSQLLLSWLPLGSAIGLLLLLVFATEIRSGVFFSMCLIGFCYGSIIALYPVLVADLFGALSAPRIYGQIFTAWGLAGMVGPWLSGWLYDLTQDYAAALILATVLSFLSMLFLRFLNSRPA